MFTYLIELGTYKFEFTFDYLLSFLFQYLV